MQATVLVLLLSGEGTSKHLCFCKYRCVRSWLGFIGSPPDIIFLCTLITYLVIRVFFLVSSVLVWCGSLVSGLCLGQAAAMIVSSVRTESS